MSTISTQKVAEAIYNLCLKSNTCLNEDVYLKILDAYKSINQQENKVDTCSNSQSEVLKSILQNAKIAYDKKLPLCQDTGQVIIFLEIGQNVVFDGDFLYDEINNAVNKCYFENYFRKSIVNNAVFNRKNTKTNTPAVIYTKYVKGGKIKINVMIKGGGSENKSKFKMLLPTSSEDEIIKEISELILSAGESACPPMFIGIGIGGTAEKAILLSKEAFFQTNFSEEEKNLASKIINYINLNAPQNYSGYYVLDVKLLTSATHIASMPVGITVNCHSDRISSCLVSENETKYFHKIPNFIDFGSEQINKKEINLQDITAIEQLKQGEEILLTGELYVARDMAHKRLIELIKNNKPLPIDLKNKTIFYAGPCPDKSNGMIGSIGPTTASRMDKYAVELYEQGIIAAIGKGERSSDTEQYIKNNNKKYFTVTGGIAALLAQKIVSKEIIAFKDLDAEAIYKLYVDKFPVKVAIA